jgi:hypothetical protein
MAEPLKPVFSRWVPELGEWQWGLNEDDFKRVMAGYACGVCLEPFPAWVPRCPVCGAENVPVSAERPPEWEKQGA